MSNVEMVIDSIRVSLMNQQRVVILKEKEGERYLPCWIGPSEADAIAICLQEVSVPRPLTHDFVCTIINKLDGVVKEAVIDKLKDDCFYAKLVIRNGENETQIDCRPSDALAVAVRLGIPIFTDEKILKKVGITLDPETGAPIDLPVNTTNVSSESSHIESFSESTQDILNQAEIEAKNYKHNFINTGHLLLALIKDENTATDIIKELNIDLDKLRSDTDSVIKKQSNSEGNEQGLTPFVKSIIQASINEAKRLGSIKVKPEHILLGCIRQDNGIAVNQFRNLGINPEMVYIELIRLYTRPWYQQ
jgi:bifunctional DNase/RNase